MIAALRARSGLSQNVMAGQAGIRQSTLSRIERGQLVPDVFLFSRLAKTIGLSAAELQRHVDEAIKRTREAAADVTPNQKSSGGTWWKAALAVAGIVGVSGLAAYAVSAMFQESEEDGKAGS